MIAGVMHPDIIGMVCLWLGKTLESHGNGVLGGSVGSSERAWVSSFFTCAMTSFGSTKRRPVVSSLIIERLVDRG